MTGILGVAFQRYPVMRMPCQEANDQSRGHGVGAQNPRGDQLLKIR